MLARWLRRYGPAELAAILAALACVTLAALLTNNELVLALTSACSTVAGYYGVMFARELTRQVRSGASLRPATAAAARNLALEFGGAEALDSLLVSPMLVYLCMQSLPNPHVAVTVSELASSVVFYTLVITARQTRLARLRREQRSVSRLRVLAHPEDHRPNHKHRL